MDAPPPASPTLIFAPHEQDHSILNPGDMWWWVQGHAWLSAAQLFETYLVTIGRGDTYSECTGHGEADLGERGVAALPLPAVLLSSEHAAQHDGGDPCVPHE